MGAFNYNVSYRMGRCYERADRQMLVSRLELGSFQLVDPMGY